MNATEIRQRITAEIAAAIGQNLPPWRKPWSDQIGSGFPCNFHSKRLYTGVNPLVMILKGFTSPNWGTLETWQRHLRVRPVPGVFPTEIIFFRFIPKKDKSGRIERIAGGKPKMVPVLRTFGVYNAEQLEGENEEAQQKLKRYLPSVKVVNIEPDFAPAEKLIAAIGADIRYGGDHARYLGGEDRILLPDKRSFESMASYYETSFHEHFHWAMHPERVGKRLKQDSYAFNELVADIGACFLCAHLRVPHADTMLEATKQYVASWLVAMNNEPRYIFDAAAHASKITDYLLGFKMADSKAA